MAHGSIHFRQKMPLFHQNLCRTGITGAFDTHHVVALIQVSEINALGSGHRFGERFYQMAHHVEHLYAYHRGGRHRNGQHIVRKAKLHAVHRHSHNLSGRFARRRLFLIVGARRLNRTARRLRGTAGQCRTARRLNLCRA